MQRILETVTLTLAVIGLAATALPAQPGPGRGKGEPKYDPETEITVTGTVQEVEHPDGPRGWQGVHLALQVGEETHSVHLGPREFVEEDEGFVFQAGDTIDVIGSEVVCRGEDALLAREITRGDETLTLRDEDGRPMWAGRRMK